MSKKWQSFIIFLFGIVCLAAGMITVITTQHDAALRTMVAFVLGAIGSAGIICGPVQSIIDMKDKEYRGDSQGFFKSSRKNQGDVEKTIKQAGDIAEAVDQEWTQAREVVFSSVRTST